MIDAAKKYTSGGHPVEHLHRAPDGWAGPYPWRGMASGGEKTWTDEGKCCIWENTSEDDLIEVREPLRARVLVSNLEKPYNIVDCDGITVPNGWRIVEMIEVMPASNPPTA